ncbi:MULTISPECIES: sodium:proton antiporter [unclassified Actinomyces]|uniref:sodium:proton antiporter n=1 Tax=unclassified Actinomyces TaxID=2609248 RepID=UPI00201761B7|nr:MULTISPECIES: sodium:proton antiporter [unclassified Actinomyces]MCL3776575.1 sodium:proton antiporter [Actinomyces sp. AC-20-1]MCL3788861.1 sodium:proton antiporter [Actinomyces sp. 187325]MCL3791033.1 sodium:proton antiporter [Actinomyces sp. 186855]MCL3793441.1 sodium:proton antiporter [Actinomyces sp. 217892]
MHLQWWSILPFAAMLASIAVLPLVPRTAHWWEKQSSQLAVALLLGVPVAVWMWLTLGWQVVFASVVEYGQFIALLLALFVVSGGIFLKGDIEATPRNNTLFLAVGGVLASFIGTTGAAMLLIRPLLNTNQERRYRVHTVLFTIFVVANCGGLLTPLGDPPLFLGFLRGVPFTWTFSLVWEWAFVLVMMLAAYFALDSYCYAQEPAAAVREDRQDIEPLGLRGASNLVWFVVIIAAVALAPSIDAEAIEAGHATLADWVPVREIIMLTAAWCSYRLGDKRARFEDNQFEWGPIAEVATLFIGIFLTMIPALHYLDQVAGALPLNEITFFVFTGGLSSVLDNAPTYATFFEMAGQVAHPGGATVAGVPEVYLASISLGAVLCGALTYIGNGPNFMVKSVAEGRGVEMPSFGGYIAKSLTYLAPVLLAMVCLFIAEPLWAKASGAALVVLLLGNNVRLLRHARRLSLQDA